MNARSLLVLVLSVVALPAGVSAQETCYECLPGAIIPCRGTVTEGTTQCSQPEEGVCFSWGFACNGFAAADVSPTGMLTAPSWVRTAVNAGALEELRDCRGFLLAGRSVVAAGPLKAIVI